MADTLFCLGHHGSMKGGKKTYNVTYGFLCWVLTFVFFFNDWLKSVNARYVFLPFVTTADSEIKQLQNNRISHRKMNEMNEKQRKNE